MDEAGSGPSGATVQMAIERINYLNSQVPGINTIQTGVPHPEYNGLNVDVWVPNVWSEKHDSEYLGMYSSCMATGNCVNTSTPNPRTTSPVCVIEGDPISDWQGTVDQAHEYDCDAVMHYSATQMLTTCWEDQYNEGGNGAGTQVYYDPANGDPWPSVRLLNYHIALQRVTKERLG